MDKEKLPNLSKTVKKGFVSELDRLFHELDSNRKTFPAARLEEIRKHWVIASKRDKR